MHCGHARTASQYASLAVVKELHVAVSRTMPRAPVVAAGNAEGVAAPSAAMMIIRMIIIIIIPVMIITG